MQRLLRHRLLPQRQRRPEQLLKVTDDGVVALVVDAQVAPRVVADGQVVDLAVAAGAAVAAARRLPREA